MELTSTFYKQKLQSRLNEYGFLFSQWVNSFLNVIKLSDSVNDIFNKSTGTGGRTIF